MIPQYCDSLTQKTATFVKSLEGHDKNSIARHVASPLITMIALEAISILAIFYYTVDVIKKTTFIAAKFYLQKIPTNWTKKVSHHFPKSSNKDSLASSVKKLAAAVRAATIGSLYALYTPKRDQHLLFHTKKIFTKEKTSIISHIEKAKNNLHKHIKQNKTEYITSALVISGTLLAYSFLFTKPVFNYEEMSNQMTEEFQKNSELMPEQVKDWSVQSLCQGNCMKIFLNSSSLTFLPCSFCSIQPLTVYS